MKIDEVYDAWKERKGQIDIREDFTDEVMNQVYQYVQKKKKPLLDMKRFVEVIYAHPLVKAGMVAVGVVVGFIRMAFTVYMFLGT